MENVLMLEKNKEDLSFSLMQEIEKIQTLSKLCVAVPGLAKEEMGGDEVFYGTGLFLQNISENLTKIRFDIFRD